MGSKRNKQKSRPVEFSTYCIEILDWEIPYSFSLDAKRKFGLSPYWEHASLKITGKLTYPEKVAGKDISIVILGDRDEVAVINSPEKFTSCKPKAIGGLTIRGKQ